MRTSPLAPWLRRSALALVPLISACAAAQQSPSAATSTEPEPQTQPAADRALTEEHLDNLEWRSIGPANMGGRIAAIAMAPGNPRTFFLGYATGGIWKTTNNGTTFTPVFDEEKTSSIGSLAVCDAPADWPGWDDEEEPVPADERAEKGKAKIVWAGTGEGNGRNSSSWGNGVYRSTDAGSSWTHLGLADSHDIPALAVDPRDPDVCYVAALGHLWGPNETRGVYKTTDGGETWDAVLQIDENTGACDVLVDPDNPDTVYAAMYMRRRSISSFRSGGPEGGIYKSTDAGASWTKLTSGLPSQTGRIGLTIYPGDTDILYAVVESDVGGKIKDEWTNRSRAGGVFRTDDGGATWTRTTDFNPRPFYFSRIEVDPTDPDRVYVLGWYVYLSEDAGRNFRPIAQVAHVDYHAILINPDDPEHILVGNDGGLYVSWDRGETWDFHNHMAVGQFYNVTVDNSDPYRVGGGLQDNGTWIGPSETIFTADGEFMGRKGAITNNDWRFVLGGDGFHVAFDPEDENIIYAEWQGGNISRMNMATGEYRIFKPAAKEGEPRYRFNWNAPFFVSAHDPDVLYHAGNCVFKLTDKGEKWERISDDLSTNDPDIILAAGSEAETAGTVTALAESPIEQGLLWAGTDDGRLHVTFNEGDSWREVTPPQTNGWYFADIAASAHKRDRAYVAIDGHRSDRFDALLVTTDDAGRTWTNITGNLPGDSPVQTVAEDPRNENVLYVGNERAVWYTCDRGENWVRLDAESLPTVPVDDLVIQKREMDLVAGTHGRSVWILDDISALSQMTPEIASSDLHLFEPMPGKPRLTLSYGGLWSDRMFIAQNPPMGAVIQYWIGGWRDEEVKLSIENDDGHTLRELTGTNAPGINRVVWDLQPDEKQRLGNPHGEPEFVDPGTYTVKLTWGDHSAETTVEVLAAP